MKETSMQTPAAPGATPDPALPPFLFQPPQGARP